MKEAPRPVNTEINISLASQLIPEARLPFLSASFYVDQALSAGYDAHEWYPLKNTTLVGLQTNTGEMSEYVKNNIHSAHQSWRTEKNLLEAWRHPNRVLAIGSYGLFPHTDDSPKYIDRLQRHLGRKLPVVIYPDTKAGRGLWSVYERTYQPYSGLMREFGVSSIQEMIDEGKKRGFDGLTIDIHHMLDLGQWQEVLPQLLPHAFEIHVAVGRIEQLEKDPKTEQKLEDLYFGRKNTEIYQILETIKKSGWNGRIVTEIPYQALKNMRVRNKTSIAFGDLTQDHRRIVDNLKEIFK